MSVSVIWLICVLLSLFDLCNADSLGKPKVATPTLTLPYATYQANSYDSQNDIWLFANIRFAAAPTGTLRWASPAPAPTVSGIQDGSYGFRCPQYIPSSEESAIKLPSPGLDFQDTSELPPAPERKGQEGILPRPGVGAQLPEISEDCLFLDVFVPSAALNPGSRFPVLFWIHGGGYVNGTKLEYNGTALVKASNNTIIFVQTNYRLGAFGFLASSLLQGYGGVANVGLLDQDAALNWTKLYIGRLGGDNTAITVIGESAGAGSILHHITAKGGTSSPVFRRAIVQSPAFIPQYNPDQLFSQYYSFAQTAGCPAPNPLPCLRSQSTERLQQANNIEISRAPYGQFWFGPAIDGAYVRDLPGRELLKGNYAKGIQLMLGHNYDEGFIFTDPDIIFDFQFNEWVDQQFPYSSQGFRDYVINIAYPSADYDFNFERLDTLISDGVLNCNVLYLSRAFSNYTYNYEFEPDPYPPGGFHGTDLCYTFYPYALEFRDYGNVCDLWYLSPVPQQFQRYLVSFVKYGNPNSDKNPNNPNWPYFGTEKLRLEVYGLEDFDVAPDDQLPEDRCRFWQPAPYLG